MRIRLLGPTSVVGPVGGQAGLGGQKQRAVLALLALDAGRVVPADRLVDRLWGDAPPDRAVQTLRSYVSRLRRALELCSAAPLLVTRPPGWVLELDRTEIDVHRFAAALASARRLTEDGDDTAAADALQTGLAMWDGPALADLRDLPALREQGEWLDDSRLEATELLLEAWLRLDRPGPVVAAARRLVEEHPFRERAWRTLVVALYRTGRQSDAVAASATVRRLLADELGLDPAPETARLELQVLRHEVDDLPRTAVDPRPASGRPYDRREAHRVGGGADALPFVGRSDALERLSVGIEAAVAGRGRLLVLEGAAGAGKSTLLRHLSDGVTAAGGIVLRGAGVGGQVAAGDVPALWPWMTVVDALVKDDVAGRGTSPHPIVPRSGPAAGALALLRPVPGRTDAPGEPGPAGLTRTSLFRGVLDLLAEAREQRLVAVVLDDAHWVDEESLLLLRLAVTQLAPAGVLFVVAVRSGEPVAGRPSSPWDGVDRDVVERIPLPALVPEHVAELVRAAGGGPAETAEVAAAVHERTRGNPFFVVELVRLLAAEGRLTRGEVDRALPDGVIDVLRQRLDRLGAGARGVLVVTALVTGPVEVDLLADVLGLDADTVLSDAEEALAAGLLRESESVLGGLEPGHDLLRHTLRADLSAARALRLHARLAAAILSRGPLTPEQIAEVARHLVLAAPAVGPAAAVPYLLQAAADAASRFAGDQATAILDRAGELVSEITHPAQRSAFEAQLRSRLMELRIFFRAELAPDLQPTDAELARLLPTGLETASDWLTAVVMIAADGRVRRAEREAHEALAVGLSPTGELAARFVLVVTGYLLGHLEQVRRQLTRFEVLLADASVADIPGAFVMVADGAPAYAAMVAHCEGDDAEADRLMDLAQHRATSDGARATMELYRAQLAAMRGDTEDAGSRARLLERHGERLDQRIYALHGRLLAAWAAGAPGQLRCAWEDYLASGLRIYAPFYLLLQAEVHAATGDRAAAVACVAEAGEVTTATGEVCLVPRLSRLADRLAAERASAGEGA